MLHHYNISYISLIFYLQSKVRTTYNSLNLQFKIDERFLSPSNQNVTDALIDQVYTDSGGIYNVKDIKRKTHPVPIHHIYVYFLIF